MTSSVMARVIEHIVPANECREQKNPKTIIIIITHTENAARFTGFEKTCLLLLENVNRQIIVYTKNIYVLD